jgi:hypothetical protein
VAFIGSCVVEPVKQHSAHLACVDKMSMKPRSRINECALAISAIIILLNFACAMKQPELKVGGLYSVNDGEGSYRIAKILALDDSAVHIRLYKNKYRSRPATVDASLLSLGTIHDKDGFGMGHLPLSRAVFANWQPVFLFQSTVTDEELEGYEMWKEGQGGVFGGR